MKSEGELAKRLKCSVKEINDIYDYIISNEAQEDIIEVSEENNVTCKQHIFIIDSSTAKNYENKSYYRDIEEEHWGRDNHHCDSVHIHIDHRYYPTIYYSYLPTQCICCGKKFIKLDIKESVEVTKFDSRLNYPETYKRAADKIVVNIRRKTTPTSFYPYVPLGARDEEILEYEEIIEGIDFVLLDFANIFNDERVSPYFDKENLKEKMIYLKSLMANCKSIDEFIHKYRQIIEEYNNSVTGINEVEDKQYIKKYGMTKEKYLRKCLGL